MKTIKTINIDHYMESLSDGMSNDTMLEKCRNGSGVFAVQNELNGIEKTLRDFISDAGQNIKCRIYPALKSGDYRHSTVEAVDLNYIIATYMEYNDGMYEFAAKTISELLSDVEVETIGQAYKHIQQVSERDLKFIQSIEDFSDYSLDEAFKNVEAVVDVFEVFDQIRTKIADLGDRIPCEDVTRKKALIATLFLYAQSSINFARYVSKGIITTYEKVFDTIEAGPTKRIQSDDDGFVLV